MDITRGLAIDTFKKNVSALVKNNDINENYEFSIMITSAINFLTDLQKCVKWEPIQWREYCGVIPEWYVLNGKTKSDLDKTFL